MWSIWIMFYKLQAKKYYMELEQLVILRQLKKQQKNIENIRYRIYRQLKRNTWGVLKIFTAQ